MLKGMMFLASAAICLACVLKTHSIFFYNKKSVLRKVPHIYAASQLWYVCPRCGSLNICFIFYTGLSARLFSIDRINQLCSSTPAILHQSDRDHWSRCFPLISAHHL